MLLDGLHVVYVISQRFKLLMPVAVKWFAWLRVLKMGKSSWVTRLENIKAINQLVVLTCSSILSFLAAAQAFE